MSYNEILGPDSFGGTDEGSHYDNSAHKALKEELNRMASRENGIHTRGGEAGCGRPGGLDACPTAGTASTVAPNEIGQRQFATGATRSAVDHKIDFEGHLNPEVLMLCGDYMHRHRINRRSGETRASDNWQRGIPLPAYMKSLVRHLLDLWRVWRGKVVEDPDSPDHECFTLGDLLCAIIFNAMGMLYELQKVGGHLRLYVTDDMRRALEDGVANPPVFALGAYPTSPVCEKRQDTDFLRFQGVSDSSLRQAISDVQQELKKREAHRELVARSDNSGGGDR